MEDTPRWCVGRSQPVGKVPVGNRGDGLAGVVEPPSGNVAKHVVDEFGNANHGTSDRGVEQVIQLAGTMPTNGRAVAQNRRELLRLTDAFRVDAAAVLRSVLAEASWKRVQSADVPGAKAEYLSRAKNGCDSNPLYRIAALLVLMRRLGMGREGALRLLGWLREIVDRVWPVEEAPSLEEALDRAAEQDPRDDYLRFQAAKCPVARVKLIEETRRENAVNAVLLLALQQAEVR